MHTVSEHEPAVCSRTSASASGSASGSAEGSGSPSQERSAPSCSCQSLICSCRVDQAHGPSHPIQAKANKQQLAALGRPGQPTLPLSHSLEIGRCQVGSGKRACHAGGPDPASSHRTPGGESKSKGAHLLPPLLDLVLLRGEGVQQARQAVEAHH